MLCSTPSTHLSCFLVMSWKNRRKNHGSWLFLDNSGGMGGEKTSLLAVLGCEDWNLHAPHYQIKSWAIGGGLCATGSYDRVPQEGREGYVTWEPKLITLMCLKSFPHLSGSGPEKETLIAALLVAPMRYSRQLTESLWSPNLSNQTWMLLSCMLSSQVIHSAGLPGVFSTLFSPCWQMSAYSPFLLVSSVKHTSHQGSIVNDDQFKPVVLILFICSDEPQAQASAISLADKTEGHDHCGSQEKFPVSFKRDTSQRLCPLPAFDCRQVFWAVAAIVK